MVMIILFLIVVLFFPGCSGGMSGNDTGDSGTQNNITQSFSDSNAGSNQPASNSEDSVGVKVKIKWPETINNLNQKYISDTAKKVVINLFKYTDELNVINQTAIYKPDTEAIIKSPLGKVTFELYADDSGTIISDCKKLFTVDNNTTDISLELGITIIKNKDNTITIRPQVFKCPVGTSFPIYNYSDLLFLVDKKSSDENSPFTESPILIDSMKSIIVTILTHKQVGEHK